MSSGLPEELEQITVRLVEACPAVKEEVVSRLSSSGEVQL